MEGIRRESRELLGSDRCPMERDQAGLVDLLVEVRDRLDRIEGHLRNVRPAPEPLPGSCSSRGPAAPTLHRRTAGGAAVPGLGLPLRHGHRGSG